MKTAKNNPVRSLDDIGRVCVPQPMRRALGLNKKDKLVFKYAESGNALIVHKTNRTK